MSDNMTIEETINGLQDMIQSKRYIEHNFDGVVDEDVCERAIALLKKQEEQIKNRDESLEKAREEIKWLRGMLKEQEAVKPVEEFAKGTNRHDYHCKRCGNIVGTILDDKHSIFPGAKLSIKHFCDVCGQAVKWE